MHSSAGAPMRLMEPAGSRACMHARGALGAIGCGALRWRRSMRTRRQAAWQLARASSRMSVNAAPTHVVGDTCVQGAGWRARAAPCGCAPRPCRPASPCPEASPCQTPRWAWTRKPAVNTIHRMMTTGQGGGASSACSARARQLGSGRARRRRRGVHITAGRAAAACMRGSCHMPRPTPCVHAVQLTAPTRTPLYACDMY